MLDLLMKSVWELVAMVYLHRLVHRGTCLIEVYGKYMLFQW